MSFWGVSVKPNTTKSATIPEDCGLTLYTVALRDGDAAKFSLTINGEEFFIATLIKGVFPQHKLKFDIAPGSDIVFKCVSDTNGTIDITGVLITIEEDEDDEDDFDGDEDADLDDFDEEDDDEEEEEEEEEAAPKKAKVEAAKKKAEPAKKAEQPAQKKAKTEEGKKIKCPACEKTFGTEQGRDAHFEAKHKKK